MPDARSQLGTALRRARWTIFWERLWPALATLATVDRSVPGGVLARAVALAAAARPRSGMLAVCDRSLLAAAVPFTGLHVPAAADGLRRLDRGSGLRHRPATTIADELAVTPQDPYSLALWKAHVERTLAAARAFKAGWPSPRIAGRDPYALRGLVLIACIATFIAAGGEHWKRIVAAFDWQGVVLPANFRVDAWVTPPAYTGKPPVILAGMHPGEPGAASRRRRRAGFRSGRQHARGARHRQTRSRYFRQRRRDPRQGSRAGAGRHARVSVQDRGDRQRDAARCRRRFDLGVQCHSRPAADHRARQGSRAAGARLAAVVLPPRGRLRSDPGAGHVCAQRPARGKRRRAASALRAARFRAGAAAGAHQERRRPDHQGFDRPSLGRRRQW